MKLRNILGILRAPSHILDKVTKLGERDDAKPGSSSPAPKNVSYDPLMGFKAFEVKSKDLDVKPLERDNHPSKLLLAAFSALSFLSTTAYALNPQVNASAVAFEEAKAQAEALKEAELNANLQKKHLRELYEIVVDKRTQRLYVLDRTSGKIVKTFVVSTGRKGFDTPTRDWRVTEITPNPWWYPPKSRWARGKKPVPPGPNNPLGVLKIRLSGTTILIHGVPKYEYKYLGRPASHGCIRMRNEDILELKKYVELGTRVRTVDGVKLDGDKVVSLKYHSHWVKYESQESGRSKG